MRTREDPNKFATIERICHFHSKCDTNSLSLRKLRVSTYLHGTYLRNALLHGHILVSPTEIPQ